MKGKPLIASAKQHKIIILPSMPAQDYCRLFGLLASSQMSCKNVARVKTLPAGLLMVSSYIGLFTHSCAGVASRVRSVHWFGSFTDLICPSFRSAHRFGICFWRVRAVRAVYGNMSGLFVWMTCFHCDGFLYGINLSMCQTR